MITLTNMFFIIMAAVFITPIIIFAMEKAKKKKVDN